jgi:PAS domain S-box-containing protein
VELMAEYDPQEADLDKPAKRDAATRRDLECALRQSEACVRALSRHPGEMVIVCDMNRRIASANPAVQAITGFTVQDLRRRPFACWVDPEDRPLMEPLWEALFAGVAFSGVIYRLVTRLGQTKSIRSSWEPLIDESGLQVGVLGREREAVDAPVQGLTTDVEAGYRRLFEDAPFPMWDEDLSAVRQFLDELAARGVKDIAAHLISHRDDIEECVRRIRVLDVNRAAREFYGANREQLAGGDLNAIFDDAAYRNLAAEMEALHTGRATFRSDLQTRTFRGEMRTVTMIVSLRPWPGDWSRAIVSFFDVTDQKRMEKQALQAQRLESLGRLAGGVAHDFNNLLMVISGYTDLLLGDEKLPAPVRTGLSEIRAAGQRGADLTQQLLAFSRKQSGRPREIDVNALIREIQPALERSAGPGIETRVTLDSGAWHIRADRSQIHQAIANLVQHARQAMPNGGILTLETRNVAEGGEEFLRISVSDTGIAMDDHTREHIFEPFYAKKGSVHGTGLGLAMVFGVVAQAGGHMMVTSEEGKGSTFSAFLPRLLVRAGAVKAAVHGGTPVTARATHATVLLVEDQPEVRRLTSMILGRLGYTVMEAAGGDEAVAVAAKHTGTIEILLTDVIMPGMNGKELADRMASLRPEAKVVFMSGYTDRVMTQDGVLPASVVYLQKPFTAEQLDATLRRVLE